MGSDRQYGHITTPNWRIWLGQSLMMWGVLVQDVKDWCRRRMSEMGDANDLRRCQMLLGHRLKGLHGILSHTHLPCTSWCRWRVMSRKPHPKHLSSKFAKRDIPLQVGDYASVRSSTYEDVLASFIGTMHPTRELVIIPYDQKWGGMICMPSVVCPTQ